MTPKLVTKSNTLYLKKIIFNDGFQRVLTAQQMAGNGQQHCVGIPRAVLWGHQDYG
jgi:hypothetical protein